MSVPAEGVRPERRVPLPLLIGLAFLIIGAILPTTGPSRDDFAQALAPYTLNATEAVSAIYDLAAQVRVAGVLGGVLIGLGLACILGSFLLGRAAVRTAPRVVYVPVVRYLDPHIREVLNATEATKIALQALPPTVLQRIVPLQSQIQMSPESRTSR